MGVRLRRIGRSSFRRGLVVPAAAVGLIASMTAVSFWSPLTTVGPAAAATSCGEGDPTIAAGTCHITVDLRDYPTGAPLTNFNYIVNVDNSKLPGDPLA